MKKNLLIDMAYHRDSSAIMNCLQSLSGAAFLDSACSNADSVRYDILTALPTRVITQLQGKILVIDHDGASTFSPAGTLFEETELSLLKLSPESLVNDSLLSNLPFKGGAIGYFGYDALTEEVESVDYLNTPMARIGIYHWGIVVDHERRKSQLFILENCPDSIREQALELSHLNWESVSGSSPPPSIQDEVFSLTSCFKSDISETEYVSAFEKVQDYILQGDCYQVNLAQRFHARYEGSPYQAYAKIRRLSQSPFSAYIGLESGAVLSFSPERFLQVRDGLALTQPIKGTRPRGVTPAEDSANRYALINSVKDRAENLMIVDLLRNDLGVLCETGSIKADNLFELQSFSNVHHLVSSVTGRLPQNVSALQLLKTSFPGGSITGAPKIRAMEIIKELESHPRSVYCGSIGFMGFDGNIDTNIMIRTLLCDAGRIYCWGGGAIVSDSEAKSEYQECFDKINFLINALG